MTEEVLEQLISIKGEIEDICNKLENTKDDSYQLSTDKVKGSSKYFPYSARNFTIEGIDEEEKVKIKKLKLKRQMHLKELLDQENEILDFINSIKESQLRRIFTMTFVEGYNYEEVGKKLHMDRRTVSRKNKNYLGE